jgi:hypothetical protein
MESRLKRLEPAIALLACAAIACEGSVEPGRTQVHADIQPELQWSGEPITIRSEQFRRVDDDDIGLTIRYQPVPSRTAQTDLEPTFLIDHERIGDEAIRFTVPPLYSGYYTARVTIPGFDPGTIYFGAVGLARPPRALLHAYTNARNGLALPPRRMVAAAEVDYWQGPDGYVVVDLETYEREIIPGLERHAQNPRVVKMYVPGPSYRPNHMVVDFSAPDSIGAEVWYAGGSPRDFAPVATLPCGRRSADGDYTAAELGENRCLVLNWRGQLLDAAGTVLADDPGLEYGEIRLAPGGRWAVPVTRLSASWGSRLANPVPVIANDGSVAYTLADYVELPGVDFSSEGDTLFLVGAKRLPGTDTETWLLDVLDASSGASLAEIGFGTRVRLRAVLVDPARSLLYVAGVGPEDRVFLAVLDRNTWESIAIVPAVLSWATGDGPLVFGGSSGRIHFLSYCGGDCGGMHDYPFDTK